MTIFTGVRDFTANEFDVTLHDVESEARSLYLAGIAGPVEAIEQMLLVFFGYTNAVIFYAEEHFSVCNVAANGDCFALFGILTCVGDEVEHDVPENSRVSVHTFYV